MLGIKWIIQFQFNVKRKARFTYEPPIENFGGLTTALRLFKVGVIGYNNIYSYPLAKWDKTISANLTERKISGKTYTLSRSEVYEFKKWWKEFKKSKGLLKKKAIEIAIQRFNYSYERVSLEDKLIDYVIAFESLLLTGESEKKFKFAQRGAFLLGKEIKDPKKRYNYMKEARAFLSEAYNLRSSIVHGSKGLKNKTKINKKEVPMQTFIEVIEEYLRKSIKIYLKISTQKKKEIILKDLDDSIFNIN